MKLIFAFFSEMTQQLLEGYSVARWEMSYQSLTVNVFCGKLSHVSHNQAYRCVHNSSACTQNTLARMFKLPNIIIGYTKHDWLDMALLIVHCTGNINS